VHCEEVDGYLAAKSQSISRSQAFPLATEAFQKSSSIFPSSAAVERLFSAASQILTNRSSCRMDDETLDHLLFLRSRLSLDARLFSAASQILTNRSSCRMDDETLDHLLFLRSRLSLDAVHCTCCC